MNKSERIVKLNQVLQTVRELLAAEGEEPNSGPLLAEPAESFREVSHMERGGDGESYSDFYSTTLGVAFDEEGRQVLKVRGGQFNKFGVRIWPEVLTGEFGVDPETLTPGLHPFKHHVRALMGEKGPRKVIGKV